MSAALDLVKSLAAAGVEFSTDGERLRWRNGDGRLTPEIVATLAAEKGAVIDFLTGKRHEPEPPASSELQLAAKLDTVARPDDAEQYADALRHHGPMSYGMAMLALGWGGTRAGQAEAALRLAGRFSFNRLGRAVLVEGAGR